MKERPILFNTEMVKAVLEGRKTQTRRVINKISGKGKITEFQKSTTKGYDFMFRDKRALWNDISKQWVLDRCPYGKVGDELWVRETFTYDNKDYIKTYKDEPWRGEPDKDNADCYYKASENDPDIFPKWKPSIFMPRWASRIQLIITDTKVERVKKVTPEDAFAEGVRCLFHDEKDPKCNGNKYPFMLLWDSINKKRGYSWESNPWVWAITFKRIKETNYES